MTHREASERALTVGPDHRDWPFQCFWCSAVLTAPTHFPYCSVTCAVRAETEGKEK